MRSDRLRPLLDGAGPFASIYFDDSHNTEHAEHQIDLTWRGIRKDLEAHGAGSPLVNKLERVIFASTPAVGSSGRGLIATADKVMLDEHLTRPPDYPTARLSDLPYVLPLVAHADEPADYLLVAVDHTGADVTEHRAGTEVTREVDGGGYPVHKAAGAERPGYGDPQQRTDEAARKNIRATAHTIAQLVDEFNYAEIFVLGEVRSRTDLLGTLPKRLLDRVTELTNGARHSGVDDDQVRQEIGDALRRRALTTMGEAARRFEEGRSDPDGLVAEGLAEVCAALRDGNVDTLIVNDLRDATVLADSDNTRFATDPDTLSELGAAAVQPVRADEALPLAAVAVGASLLQIDERVNPADGVAALLRYLPSTT